MSWVWKNDNQYLEWLYRNNPDEYKGGYYFKCLEHYVSGEADKKKKEMARHFALKNQLDKEFSKALANND